jgi:hypothetical protein
VKPPKRLGTQNSPTVRIKSAVVKVHRLVERPDPYTLRLIVNKTQVSYSSISRKNDHDLDMKKYMTTKTHALSNKMVDQRVFKGPRLLQWIKRNKWKNIVTIDGAWAYMSHVNGHRKSYYKFQRKNEPSNVDEILPTKTS